METKRKIFFVIIVIIIAIIVAGVISLNYGNKITKNLNGTDFTVPTNAGNNSYNIIKNNDSAITVTDETVINGETKSNKSLVIHTTSSYDNALAAARNVSNQYKERSGQAIPNETNKTKIANVTVTKIKLNYGNEDFFYYFTKDNKSFYMFGYPEQWNTSIIKSLIS